MLMHEGPGPGNVTLSSALKFCACVIWAQLNPILIAAGSPIICRVRFHTLWDLAYMKDGQWLEQLLIQQISCLQPTLPAAVLSSKRPLGSQLGLSPAVNLLRKIAAPKLGTCQAGQMLTSVGQCWSEFDQNSKRSEPTCVAAMLTRLQRPGSVSLRC